MKGLSSQGVSPFMRESASFLFMSLTFISNSPVSGLAGSVGSSYSCGGVVVVTVSFDEGGCSHEERGMRKEE
jgi:hypothetical protein